MMTGRELEGSGRGLYYTGVGLEGLRKTTSVSKTRFPAKIRTRHVPNTSLEYNQAVRWLTDGLHESHRLDRQRNNRYIRDRRTDTHTAIVFNVWFRQFQWFCFFRAWHEASRQKPTVTVATTFLPSFCRRFEDASCARTTNHFRSVSKAPQRLKLWMYRYITSTNHCDFAQPTALVSQTLRLYHPSHIMAAAT
jgi:hypothetical protein